MFYLNQAEGEEDLFIDDWKGKTQQEYPKKLLFLRNTPPKN